MVDDRTGSEGEGQEGKSRGQGGTKGESTTAEGKFVSSFSQSHVLVFAVDGRVGRLTVGVPGAGDDRGDVRLDVVRGRGHSCVVRLSVLEDNASAVGIGREEELVLGQLGRFAFDLSGQRPNLAVLLHGV